MASLLKKETDFHPLYGAQYEVSFENSHDYIRLTQPETPTYCFNPHTLQSRYTEFNVGFQGEVSYAVKANPNQFVLQTLINSGISSFDVASLGEIKLIHSLDSNTVLHFNNPVKSIQDIRVAYHRFGVKSFVLDDMNEFEKIHSVVQGMEGIELTVRFKMPFANAAYDFGSKFGATRSQAIELLCRIHKHGYKASLTFHPGSQCTDPSVYKQYIKEASTIENISGVQIFRLNVGGGFPVNYLDGGVPPLKTYMTIINSAITKFFPGNRVKVVCEPGRAMVADSVSLITQVIHQRIDGTVFLNDGAYGGLQEQLFAKLPLPTRCWDLQGVISGNESERVLFGPTCDPIDRLPDQVRIPQALTTGDWIEFGLIGAYGSATSTEFNGFTSNKYIVVEDSTF